jgi:hypothetical protein
VTLTFPSEAWFAAYGERIDEREADAELASDWGVGFDGDFLSVMTDVPVASVSDELPEDLAAEMDTHIEDGTGYGYLGLEAGVCTRAEFVAPDDPAVEQAGFVMAASRDDHRAVRLNGGFGLLEDRDDRRAGYGVGLLGGRRRYCTAPRRSATSADGTPTILSS